MAQQQQQASVEATPSWQQGLAQHVEALTSRQQQQQPRSPFGQVGGRQVAGGGGAGVGGSHEDSGEDPWATPAGAGHATLVGSTVPPAVPAKYGNNIVGFQALTGGQQLQARGSMDVGSLLGGCSSSNLSSLEWMGFPQEQQQPQLSLSAAALFAWLLLLQQQQPPQQ